MNTSTIIIIMYVYIIHSLWYNERFARIACRTRDLIFEVFFNETLLSHKMSFNWNTIKT